MGNSESKDGMDKYKHIAGGYNPDKDTYQPRSYTLHNVTHFKAAITVQTGKTGTFDMNDKVDDRQRALTAAQYNQFHRGFGNGPLINCGFYNETKNETTTNNLKPQTAGNSPAPVITGWNMNVTQTGNSHSLPATPSYKPNDGSSGKVFFCPDTKTNPFLPSESRVGFVEEREKAMTLIHIQLDKLESRIHSLECQLEMLEKKIYHQVDDIKKEEAFFTLGKIKELKQFIRSARLKTHTLETNLGILEHTKDDEVYAGVIKESNEILKNLMEQVDLESIEQAKILQGEGKMQREEIDFLIESKYEEDPELKKAVDMIEEAIFQKSVVKLPLVSSELPVPDLQARETPTKESSTQNKLDGKKSLETSKVQVLDFKQASDRISELKKQFSKEDATTEEEQETPQVNLLYDSMM